MSAYLSLCCFNTFRDSRLFYHHHIQILSFFGILHLSFSFCLRSFVHLSPCITSFFHWFFWSSNKSSLHRFSFRLFFSLSCHVILCIDRSLLVPWCRGSFEWAWKVFQNADIHTSTFYLFIYLLIQGLGSCLPKNCRETLKEQHKIGGCNHQPCN